MISYIKLLNDHYLIIQLLLHIVVSQVVKKFPTFYEPQRTLLCSQELSTDPCPEPYESNPQSHNPQSNPVITTSVYTTPRL
jgi:hypothetical protein